MESYYTESVGGPDGGVPFDVNGEDDMAGLYPAIDADGAVEGIVPTEDPDDDLEAVLADVEGPEITKRGNLSDRIELPDDLYARSKREFYDREEQRRTTFLYSSAVGESVAGADQDRNIGVSGITDGNEALAVVSTLPGGFRRAYIRAVPFTAVAEGMPAADPDRITAAMDTKGALSADAVIMSPGKRPAHNGEDALRPADLEHIEAIGRAVRLALGESVDVRVRVALYDASEYASREEFTGQGTLIVRMRPDGTHGFEVDGEPFDFPEQAPDA